MLLNAVVVAAVEPGESWEKTEVMLTPFFSGVTNCYIFARGKKRVISVYISEATFIWLFRLRDIALNLIKASGLSRPECLSDHICLFPCSKKQ